MIFECLSYSALILYRENVLDYRKIFSRQIKTCLIRNIQHFNHHIPIQNIESRNYSSR
jgi:hypothetical protein